MHRGARRRGGPTNPRTAADDASFRAPRARMHLARCSTSTPPSARPSTPSSHSALRPRCSSAESKVMRRHSSGRSQRRLRCLQVQRSAMLRARGAGALLVLPAEGARLPIRLCGPGARRRRAGGACVRFAVGRRPRRRRSPRAQVCSVHDLAEYKRRKVQVDAHGGGLLKIGVLRGTSFHHRLHHRRPRARYRCCRHAQRPGEPIGSKVAARGHAGRQSRSRNGLADDVRHGGKRITS